jgi:hypothetical protein
VRQEVGRDQLATCCDRSRPTVCGTTARCNTPVGHWISRDPVQCSFLSMGTTVPPFPFHEGSARQPPKGPASRVTLLPPTEYIHMAADQLKTPSSPPVEALCMPPIAANPCAMVWYGPECVMSCDVSCEMRQFIALGAGWEMMVSVQPCLQ